MRCGGVWGLLGSKEQLSVVAPLVHLLALARAAQVAVAVAVPDEARLAAAHVAEALDADERVGVQLPVLLLDVRVVELDGGQQGAVGKELVRVLAEELELVVRVADRLVKVELRVVPAVEGLAVADHRLLGALHEDAGALEQRVARLEALGRAVALRAPDGAEPLARLRDAVLLVEQLLGLDEFSGTIKTRNLARRQSIVAPAAETPRLPIGDTRAAERAGAPRKDQVWAPYLEQALDRRLVLLALVAQVPARELCLRDQTSLVFCP